MPLCTKEAAALLRLPAPQLSQHSPWRWPCWARSGGTKPVPEVAPRWPLLGLQQLLEEQEGAAEQGSGRWSRREPSSKAQKGCPSLLVEKSEPPAPPAPPASRLGFLQGPARDKEPIPTEVPQHARPSWAGALSGPPQQTAVLEQGQEGAIPCLGQAMEQVPQATPGRPQEGLPCRAEAVEEQGSGRGPSSTAATGRPTLRREKPSPVEVPQRSQPNTSTVGPAQEEESGPEASSKPPVGSPS